MSGKTYTLAIIIICLSRLTDHWLRMSPIPFFPEIMAGFDVGYAGVGVLFSVLSIALITMQMPAGIIVDRFPAPMISAIGMGIVGAGGVAFALAPSYGVAMAARIAMGVGGPLSEVASIAMISRLSPPRARGRTIGFVDMSVGFAYFLALGILPFVSQYLDYRMILLIPALSAILMATMTLNMSRYSILRPDESSTQSRPTGSIASSPTTLRDKSCELFSRIRATLGNRAILLLSIMAFLGFAAGDAMMVWLPTYLQDIRNYTHDGASMVMVVTLAVYVPGALLAGRASDAWRLRIRVVQVGSVLMGLAYIGILSSPADHILLLLGPLFGVGYAWNVGPMLTLATEKVRPASMGMAVSLVFMFAQLGTAVSGALLGQLVEYFEGFTVIWVVAVALLTLRLTISSSPHFSGDTPVDPPQ